MIENKTQNELVRQLAELITNYAVDIEDSHNAHLNYISVDLERVECHKTGKLTTIVSGIDLSYTETCRIEP